MGWLLWPHWWGGLLFSLGGCNAVTDEVVSWRVGSPSYAIGSLACGGLGLVPACSRQGQVPTHMPKNFYWAAFFRLFLQLAIFFFFTFKHGFFPPKILLSIKLIKFLFLRAERLYSQPVFSERLLRMLPCGWKPPFRLFHSLGSQMKFIPLHALGRYLQTLFHMVYFLNCDRTFYEWQWKLHIWSEWKINLSWHQNFSWKISAFV